MTECCYVQFEVTDEDRFARLKAAFDVLAREKNAGTLETGPQWRTLFDERALAHFWWPTPEEREAHSKRWFETPLPQRWSDPSLRTPWDFDSLIDAFANGEYEFLGVRRDGDRARLEFNPLAFPYGGVGCMLALIEAFDCKVLVINDGSQPPYAPFETV